MALNVLCVGADGRTFERLRLAVHLRWPDAAVTSLDDGRDPVAAIESEAADLVFASGGPNARWLPRFCVSVRKVSNVPLIVVGPPDAEALLEVKVLDAGADDYLTDDADLSEIVARVTSRVRRAQSQMREVGGAMRYGDVTLVPGSLEAYLRSQKLALTVNEFNLLRLLARNHGAVVTHSMIERSLWGDDVGDGESMVKKHIHRLRRKMADAVGPDGLNYVRSIYGIGYQLVSVLDAPATTEDESAAV